MENWSINTRASRGTLWASGVGLIAGACETILLAATGSADLSLPSFVVLCLAALATNGLYSAFLGGLIAWPLHFLLRSVRTSTVMALHMALVGGIVCCTYLWQAAFLVYTEERAPGAFALAAMPIGFIGVIYFNASFMARRAEIGKPLGPSWITASVATALGFTALASTLYGFRDLGGTHALPDDQNLLIITVDRWPHAQPATRVDGVFFAEAITPATDAAPAAANVLTGLHPLRNTVLFKGDALPRHYQTLAEIYWAEGYATAAFVSTSSLGSATGLRQGFAVYDDDLSPLLSGLDRINLWSHVLTGDRARSGAATVGRFERWYAGHADVPFLAWVHLPDETALDDLLALTADHSDETLRVVTALRGDGDGISEAAIRVPFWLSMPAGTEVTVDGVVPHQMRLTDIAATAIDSMGIEGPQTEGINLTGYLDRRRQKPVSATSVGRTANGEPTIGMRNNSMKYIEQPVEALFHIGRDPAEALDLSASQPDSLESARRALGPDSIGFEKLMERR